MLLKIMIWIDSFGIFIFYRVTKLNFSAEFMNRFKQPSIRALQLNGRTNKMIGDYKIETTKLLF